MNRAISLCLLRLLPEAGVPDLWVVKDGWETWLVGEKPECLFNHIAFFVPAFRKGQTAEERARTFVNGVRLKFFAKQIFDIDERGSVTTVKNRYGRDAKPPFASVPEAKLVSAARGWPDPIEFEDLFHGDASI